MTEPSTSAGPIACTVTHRVMRVLLCLWGIVICCEAVAGLLLYLCYRPSIAPEIPLGAFDVMHATRETMQFLLGLLLALPFGWLARHTRVRLVLQATTVLLLGQLLVGLVRQGPTPRHLSTFLLLAVPTAVASWMIARERRRVPAWHRTAT